MGTAYPGRVKEFWVYTALRLALFVGSLAIVVGVWLLITGEVPVSWPPFVIALVISGVASYFLLARQRQDFARRVETRAQRMSERLEEHRSREDVD